MKVKVSGKQIFLHISLIIKILIAKEYNKTAVISKYTF